jgi:hypothetical protein
LRQNEHLDQVARESTIRSNSAAVIFWSPTVMITLSGGTAGAGFSGGTTLKPTVG